MTETEAPETLTTVEARQAVTVNMMRYVLGFGLSGAIVAIAIALYIVARG